MLRKTLTIFSLIGLVLSLVLWVASYWSLQVFVGSHCYTGHSGVAMWAGGPDASSTRGWLMPISAGNDPAWRVHHVGPYIDWVHATRPIGIKSTRWWLDRFYHRDRTFPSVSIPIWILVVFFGAWPFKLFVLRATRGRRRRILGLCERCAYDLRGSEHTCSECGQPFDTKLLGKRLIPGLPKMSHRVRVGIAILVVVVMSSWYWVRTADARRAKHCVREYFRRHGAGWSPSWIDDLDGIEEDRFFIVDGYLQNERGQEMWFYIPLWLKDLPGNAGCECMIEQITTENELAMPETPVSIRLDDS